MARSLLAALRERRRCSRVVAALLAGGIVLASAGEAFAQAYTPEPIVSENIGAVADHAARGGAVQIPGVECGATCAEWWVEEHRTIPNQASSTQLQRELRTFRSRALKVLPRLGSGCRRRRTPRSRHSGFASSWRANRSTAAR